MKKTWLLLLIPLFGGAAFLIRQNLPEKRHARHMIKARLFAKESNLVAAQLEYEKAYKAIGQFTPHVSMEVLNLMNRRSLQDGNLPEALKNTRNFVGKHPKNMEGYLVLSQLAFQASDPETAFESINKVLEKDPSNFIARALLIRVRTSQGRLDLAEEQLRFLHRKYPDSVAALLPLAENLLKQGKLDASRQFIQMALATHPQNSAAKLLLVDSYLLENKIDSAHAILEAWQEESDAETARSIAIRRARYYALARKFADAESLLTKYRETKEQNTAALAELAVIKTIQGQYDSATRIFTELGEAAANLRPASERMKIFLYLKNNNPAKALEAVKILSIGSKPADLLTLNLAAYLSMGQDAKSEQLLASQPDSLRNALLQIVSQWGSDRELIGQWALVEFFRANSQGYWALVATRELHKRWPKNPLAINMYASQLIAIRQFGAAAQLLEGISGKTESQRVFLVSLYFKAGRHDKAVALAEKLLDEDPAQRGLNAYLAENAWSRGDKQKGISHYLRELEINPNDAVALNNLAWEFGIVQGDYEKAKPYLERLQAKQNLDARILDTIGWILAKNGKTAEGVKYIRAALNLVPDYPSFLYHLSYVLAQSGDKEGARKQIREALESVAQFQERKDALALLAKLE